MKKKLIIILFACFILIGCEDVEVETAPNISSVRMEYTEFNLKVDSKTGIVYIDNEIDIPDKSWDPHVYTPYYSKSGKLCRFVDGKVVEIE